MASTGTRVNWVFFTMIPLAGACAKSMSLSQIESFHAGLILQFYSIEPADHRGKHDPDWERRKAG